MFLNLSRLDRIGIKSKASNITPIFFSLPTWEHSLYNDCKKLYQMTSLESHTKKVDLNIVHPMQIINSWIREIVFNGPIEWASALPSLH